MKTIPSALDVVAALLAVGAATAFVPTSCQFDHGPILTQTLSGSTTVCFASDVEAADIGGTSSPLSSPDFPFSDKQVRFAYDEWRLIYDKGDFDKDRFENFKTNHKTLTISNLKAREKATKEGRPIPQWMSLNEYGDYSLDEYEAMMRGDQPLTDDGESMINSSGEQPVRATQAIGDDYLIDYNNGLVREYQDQFGRTVRSTQALNQENSLTSDVYSNYANNIDTDGSLASRGTLIIPKDEDDNNQLSQRGTQVIDTNGANNSGYATRGTQVIVPNGGASSGANFGTQPISGSGSRGMQVLKSGDSGDSEPSSDSGVETDIPPNQGTLIIPKDEGGTLIIPKSDAGGGAQVLPQSDVDSDEGTAVESKGEENALSKLFGNIFGDSESGNNFDDSSDVGKRGTMVIKRSIEAPEQKPLKNLFSFFDSNDTEKEEEEETEDEPEPSKGNNFFGFLGSKDYSKEIETPPTTTIEEEEEKSKTGGGIFSLFGGNVKSSNPRPVRTSISLKQQSPKKKKIPGFQSRRETKLIPDETESENGMPPILSFFGGAKKVDEEETARNPNSRPTLTVKKPKKFQWSPFSATNTGETKADKKSVKAPTDFKSAQIGKQKEYREKVAKRKAEEAKKREEKQLAAAKPEAPKVNVSPFAFFGAIGKKAEPPTLKNWKQKRDGTITGLIYDSKNYKDGTRITTSPVARGAKRGTVVKTDGGSPYSLM